MLRLLDTFCGAGGCTKGYQRAGFYVVGVDIKPQPHYCGDEFVQADALDFIREHGHEYDVIHASPPCQEYSGTKSWHPDSKHPDLVRQTRIAMLDIGKPYIIENVVGAPLENPIKLCGTMFDLYVIRHRLFETNPLILFPPGYCNHRLPVVQCGKRPVRWEQYHSVVGHFSDVEYGRLAMGIDWMTGAELSQAIPPAYTEWIGKKLLEML